MQKRKLRVGFDLDGVILYNPIRTLRPFASFFKFLKPLLFHENAESFYFPNSPIEKFIWRQLHKTSYKIADGYRQIKSLAKKNMFDAFLITSRYDFLKNDFLYWMKKIDAKNVFKGFYYNKTNMQPNAYKKHMIKKLNLDYFVEDNWGIIQKLNGDLRGIRIIWISNLLDNNIPYKYKFSNLQEVANYFARLLSFKFP